MSAADDAASLFAFEADLDRFAKAIDVAPALVVKRIVADLHGRIAKRTPVDTGRARASWDVKVGQPSNYVPPINVGGKAKGKGKTTLGAGLAGNDLGSGAANGGAIKNITAELEAIDGGAPVFITTALDYVRYLENGSSKQAPAGMVRLSVAEVEIEIESIVEQIESSQ